MLSFFIPYSFAGSVIWWLWRRIPFFKYFFTRNELQISNIGSIKQWIANDAIIAFNSGTKGPEQKTTCIGYLPSTNKRFFAKYAVSEKARALVANEYFILSLLKDFPGMPAVINYKDFHDATLLQTTFVEGEKYRKTIITDEVFQLLLKLSDVRGNFPQIENNLPIEKHFAHGDFCPWNILDTSKGLHLIDWEMGGLYTLGYDLFTFIFQTQFILYPKKSTLNILKENKDYINSYFGHLGIEEWKPYAIAFSHEKVYQNNRKNEYLTLRYGEIAKLIIVK